MGQSPTEGTQTGGGNQEDTSQLQETIDVTESNAVGALAALINDLGQFDAVAGIIQQAADQIRQNTDQLRILYEAFGLRLPTPEEIGMGSFAGSLDIARLFTADAEGNSPLQPLMDTMIANMLMAEEGEENPLQPLYDALETHVKGGGDDEGQGGLFGELTAFVKGSGDDEGKGGLFGDLMLLSKALMKKRVRVVSLASLTNMFEVARESKAAWSANFAKKFTPRTLAYLQYLTNVAGKS